MVEIFILNETQTWWNLTQILFKPSSNLIKPHSNVTMVEVFILNETQTLWNLAQI